MKIESKTDKISSSLDKSKLDGVVKSNPSKDLADFEACIKELDADKKNIENQENVQNSSTPQEKKAEVLKTIKKLAEKDRMSSDSNKIDNLNLFVHSHEFFKIDGDFKINADNLKKEDIDFLKTCFENPSITLNPQNIQADFAVQNQNGQVSYKSLEVSKSLFNLIENSFKAQKPVRVDFDGNSSVILKMNNDGKLLAEFISNDKAMEYILKSSIPNLKDKLDQEGITYEDIYYKDKSKNQNKKQNKGDNQ